MLSDLIKDKDCKLDEKKQIYIGIKINDKDFITLFFIIIFFFFIFIIVKTFLESIQIILFRIIISMISTIAISVVLLEGI